MDTSSNLLSPTVADALHRVAHRHVLVGHRSANHVARLIRNHLVPVFGHRLLDSITTSDIENFAASLRARKLAPGTVNRILDPLRAAFALYMDELPDLRRPRFLHLPERNARDVFLERSEFERIVSELSAVLQPPAWFAYFTGWRLASEVTWLRWDKHIMWDTGLVKLSASEDKNSQVKSFPFNVHPDLDLLIRAQRERMLPGCPWVFHRFMGKRIVAMDDAWRGAVHRAFCVCGRPRTSTTGQPVCTCSIMRRIPHDLRRTAARNLRDAGVSDKVIMDLVGWKTIAMLHRYLGKSREADLRAAVSKLAGNG